MQRSSFSNKLRELRKAHNYTQDYVAAALGIVRQTYSHYETGKRSPSPEILYKLAGLYKIPIDDLMQLILDIDRDVSYDAPAPTQTGQELSCYLEYLNHPHVQQKFQFLNQYEKELLYYFEQLSELDKQEIIEFTKIKSRKYK